MNSNDNDTSDRNDRTEESEIQLHHDNFKNMNRIPKYQRVFALKKEKEYHYNGVGGKFRR